MITPIDQDYRIAASPEGWQLKKKSGDEFKPFLLFKSLSEAVNELKKLNVKSADQGT